MRSSVANSSFKVCGGVFRVFRDVGVTAVTLTLIGDLAGVTPEPNSVSVRVLLPLRSSSLRLR